MIASVLYCEVRKQMNTARTSFIKSILRKHEYCPSVCPHFSQPPNGPSSMKFWLQASFGPKHDETRFFTDSRDSNNKNNNNISPSKAKMGTIYNAKKIRGRKVG